MHLYMKYAFLFDKEFFHEQAKKTLINYLALLNIILSAYNLNMKK